MSPFLIIDDSMVMRTILRYMLERGGDTVVGEAKDGGEAVALARALKPDAITIAASLRGEEGLAVLAAIRQLPWAGKVFFAAGGERPAEEEEARRAGVDGLLRKPFTLDQVSAEIRQVMNR